MKAIFRQHFVSTGHHDSPRQTTMELRMDDGAIHLQGHQHVRMDKAHGWTVRALSGKVWITQDWDLRDVVLEAGESFVFDRNASALLWPLGEAEIRLERASQRSAPHNLLMRSRPVAAFAAVRALFA